VQEDSKIFSGNAKFLTNGVLIFLVEKDSLQQFTILDGELTQRPPDQIGTFVLQEARLRTGLAAGNLTGFVRKLPRAAIPPEHLLHHVVRDGIDVSAQALRVFDHPLPEISQNAEQGFLPYVVRRVNRPEPGDGFDPDEVAEICGKVLLGSAVTLSEPPNVVRVKRKSFHTVLNAASLHLSTRD
jgi:hypothetical protein